MDVRIRDMIRTIGCSLLVVHLLSTTAWAQRPGRLPNEDGGLLQWVIAVALSVVICAPALLNPKRSHLT